MSAMSKCGDGFLGERLYNLVNLKNRGTKDQRDITAKLLHEYKTEAVARGLVIKDLIQAEHRARAITFVNSIFGG